ncbi:MAG: hypothetical protein Q8O05_06005, partial [Chloroflexota bacterium]|nr:hypothetical protein [Chloroflexota bacterium]
MNERESVGITSQIRRKPLGEILVEQNIVTASQLENALDIQRRQGGKLGEILIKKGLVAAEQLAAVLSIQLNIPLIDLKRHTVQPGALRLIPEEMARNHSLIPLDVIGDSLLVVMSDPEDIRTLKDLEAQSKMRVEVALGTAVDIERAIDLNYSPGHEIEIKVGTFATVSLEEAKLSSEFIARTPIAE